MRDEILRDQQQSFLDVEAAPSRFRLPKPASHLIA
jgi:hypothetical protein